MDKRLSDIDSAPCNRRANGHAVPSVAAEDNIDPVAAAFIRRSCRQTVECFSYRSVRVSGAHSDVLGTHGCVQTADARQAELWTYNPESRAFACQFCRSGSQRHRRRNLRQVATENHFRNRAHVDASMPDTIARFESMAVRELDDNRRPVCRNGSPRQPEGDQQAGRGDPPHF